MKTSRYLLVVVALLVGLSSAAFARPRVQVSLGFGSSSFRSGHRADNRRGSFRPSKNNRHRKWGRGQRHHRPRRRIIISRSVYQYDRNLGYCVAIKPMVIQERTVIVQPQQFDESTLQLNMSLQYRKSELLKQLQIANKELRREAIRELAGFSFDDNVRQALEDVLLSDPDPELRAEAAQAFGKVKNVNARAALEKARVEDPSEDVRRAADEAIKSIEEN